MATIGLKKIDIANKEILDLLNGYSDKLLQHGDLHSNKILKIHKEDVDIDYVRRHTSNEFLETVKNDPKHIGFPLESRGMNLAMEDGDARMYNDNIPESKDVKNLVDAMLLKLSKHFAARNVAVHMYYPEYGFIGWHTNENASGLNLLFTFNQEGNGWFKYQDPQTGKIIQLDDGKGWHAKLGYFGKSNDKDNIIWHCAYNESPRITLAFIIPDATLRDDIEDELLDPDF